MSRCLFYSGLLLSLFLISCLPSSALDNNAISRRATALIKTGDTFSGSVCIDDEGYFVGAAMSHYQGESVGLAIFPGQVDEQVLPAKCLRIDIITGCALYKTAQKPTSVVLIPVDAAPVTIANEIVNITSVSRYYLGQYPPIIPLQIMMVRQIAGNDADISEYLTSPIPDTCIEGGPVFNKDDKFLGLLVGNTAGAKTARLVTMTQLTKQLLSPLLSVDMSALTPDKPYAAVDYPITVKQFGAPNAGQKLRVELSLHTGLTSTKTAIATAKGAGQFGATIALMSKDERLLSLVRNIKSKDTLSEIILQDRPIKIDAPHNSAGEYVNYGLENEKRDLRLGDIVHIDPSFDRHNINIWFKKVVPKNDNYDYDYTATVYKLNGLENVVGLVNGVKGSYNLNDIPDIYLKPLKTLSLAVNYRLAVYDDQMFLGETTGSYTPGGTVQFKSESSIQLPSPITEIVYGGGGRYLVMWLSVKSEVAVFDTETRNIIYHLPISSRDSVIAAGMDKIIVVQNNEHIISRYSLASGAYETSARIPNDERIISITMGSSAIDSLLICTTKTDVFFNIATMTMLKDKLSNYNNLNLSYWLRYTYELSPLFRYRDSNALLATSTGKYYVNSNLSKIYDSSGAEYLPPNGYEQYGMKKLPPNDLKEILEELKVYNVSNIYPISINKEIIPTVSHDYFIAIKEYSRVTESTSISIYATRDMREICKLPVLPNFNSSDYGEAIKYYKRILYLPKSKLLITMPGNQDVLVIRELDIADE